MRILDVPAKPPVVWPPRVEMRRARRRDEVAVADARRRQVRIFETAVADEFRVQSAVASVIDLLKENPVEVGGHGGDGATEIDGDVSGASRRLTRATDAAQCDHTGEGGEKRALADHAGRIT